MNCNKLTGASNSEKIWSKTYTCVGTDIGNYQFYCSRPTSINDLHGVGAFLIMISEAEKIL